MQIMFINNDGGGFADRIVVRDHLTVRELFNDKMGATASARDYLIRVNRQPADAEQTLKEGDRVSFTPTKIEGARVCARGAHAVSTRTSAADHPLAA